MGCAEFWSQDTSQATEQTVITALWLDISSCFNQGHMQGRVASAKRKLSEGACGHGRKGFGHLVTWIITLILSLRNGRYALAHATSSPLCWGPLQEKREREDLYKSTGQRSCSLPHVWRVTSQGMERKEYQIYNAFPRLSIFSAHKTKFLKLEFLTTF